MVEKIKSKKGISTFWVLMFMPFVIAMLMVIIDSGRGMVYRMSLQAAADAMTTSAINSSTEISQNSYQGAKLNAKINKANALSTAKDLLSRNINPESGIANVKAFYNFEGCGGVSSEDVKTLYEGGVFNVNLTGTYRGLLSFTDIKVSVSSTSRIATKGNSTNANTVSIEDNKNIIVRDGKGNITKRITAKIN